MPRIRNLVAAARGWLHNRLAPGLRSSAGVRIFERSRLDIRRGGTVTLGERTRIGRGSTFVISGKVTIGRDVFFNEYAHLSCIESVKIGDRVRFGERVSIHDENHLFEPLPLADKERQGYSSGAVEVGNDVWVGANVTILPGVSIGDEAVIAAGSVVNKNVPSGVLVGGVPARVLRKLIRREVHDFDFMEE